VVTFKAFASMEALNIGPFHDFDGICQPKGLYCPFYHALNTAIAVGWPCRPFG
jgi:hypothetical protein